jgi:ProP effector
MNKQRLTAALELIPILAERFPAAFAVNPRYRMPLKLGIHVDILAQLGETITPQALSDALRIYVHNPHYLKALAAGADRVDINGMPAGKVTAEQADAAKLRRNLIFERRKAKQEQQAAIAPAKSVEASKPIASLPRRLGLADLKAAAKARQAAAATG